MAMGSGCPDTGKLIGIPAFFRGLFHIDANGMLRDPCHSRVHTDAGFYVAGLTEPAGSVHKREGKGTSGVKCSLLEFEHNRSDSLLPWK